jgi:hypothetical protein
MTLRIFQKDRLTAAEQLLSRAKRLGFSVGFDSGPVLVARSAAASPAVRELILMELREYSGEVEHLIKIHDFGKQKQTR